MKFIVRRWYFAMAFRVPGQSLPACVGFGLPRYEHAARIAASELAVELLGPT